MPPAPTEPERPKGGTSIRRRPGEPAPQQKKPTRNTSEPQPEGKPSRGTGVRVRPPVPAPVKKANTGLIAIVISAAVIVIGIGVFLATRNKPGEKEPVVHVPPPPVVAPPPPAVVPPPPPPKRIVEPELPPAPPPPADEKAAFLEKLAAARKAGLTKVEEARKRVQESIAEELARDAEFAKRFAGARRDIALVSGVKHPQAAITGFTLDNVTFETAPGKAQTVAWNLVEGDTTRAIAKHVYSKKTGEDLYELGRFFIVRHMWKDAKATLEEAKKADDSTGFKVDEIMPELDPLVTGQGRFRGQLRQIPPDGLFLTFDLKDGVQAEDWNLRTRGGEMTIADGKMTLKIKEKATWACSDLDFLNDLDVELGASGAGALLFHFHKKYEVKVDAKGVFLRKLGSDEFLAQSEAVKLGATVQRFKLTVRQRKVSVHVADKEVFTAEVPAPKGGDEMRGPFVLGGEAGDLVITGPMVVGGRLDPAELEKRFATIEMLVQRMVNPDIEMIKAMREHRNARRWVGGDGEAMSISAEEYFPFNVKPKLTMNEFSAYNQLKKKLGGGYTREDKMREKLDELVKAHPDFPAGWYIRGFFKLYYEADPQAARADFSKAIEAFPEFYEAHHMMGMCFQGEREFQKSFDCAKKAVELRPDFAEGWMLIGEMKYALDKSKAVEAEMDIRVASHLGADGFQVNRERRSIQVQAKGPRSVGAIHEHETAHYKIVTDISMERAKWYGERLELARTNYEDTMKQWYKGDTRAKPRIAIFNVREAFYTYSELASSERHENLLGFFSPPNHELVLFEEVDIRETEHTLYHEAFHHFASSIIKYPPYWWNEGIAEYMGAIRIEGGKIVERGHILKGRLDNLKQAMELQNAMEDMIKRREKDQPDMDEDDRANMMPVLPFETIMNQTPGRFYGGPFVAYKYAQVWTMVQFFYEGEGGKHRPLVEQYVSELVAGRTLREAYDATFKDKVVELEKAWKEYVKNLKPKK